MTEFMTTCPRCNGDGWTSHDCQCVECDGTGEVEVDQFYVGADLLYDEKRDNESTEME